MLINKKDVSSPNARPEEYFTRNNTEPSEACEIKLTRNRLDIGRKFALSALEDALVDGRNDISAFGDKCSELEQTQDAVE